MAMLGASGSSISLLFLIEELEVVAAIFLFFGAGECFFGHGRGKSRAEGRALFARR